MLTKIPSRQEPKTSSARCSKESPEEFFSQHPDAEALVRRAVAIGQQSPEFEGIMNELSARYKRYTPATTVIDEHGVERLYFGPAHYPRYSE